jgi:hypothetical protein
MVTKYVVQRTTLAMQQVPLNDPMCEVNKARDILPDETRGELAMETL